MVDVLIFFVWIVGLVLSVVVIVAQCQLFAIRRLLEALVKQSGSAPSGRSLVAAERAGAGISRRRLRSGRAAKGPDPVVATTKPTA